MSNIFDGFHGYGGGGNQSPKGNAASSAASYRSDTPNSDRRYGSIPDFGIAFEEQQKVNDMLRNVVKQLESVCRSHEANIHQRTKEWTQKCQEMKEWYENKISVLLSEANELKLKSTHYEHLVLEDQRKHEQKCKTLLDFAENKMSATEFELFVGCIFTCLGYEVEHVGKTKDGGIDLLLFHKEKGEGMVQVKQYRKNTKVSEPQVRDLWGVLSAKHKQYCFMVTCNSVTAAAQQWPVDNNISDRFLFWNRLNLTEFISRFYDDLWPLFCRRMQEYKNDKIDHLKQRIQFLEHSTNSNGNSNNNSNNNNNNINNNNNNINNNVINGNNDMHNNNNSNNNNNNENIENKKASFVNKTPVSLFTNLVTVNVRVPSAGKESVHCGASLKKFGVSPYTTLSPCQALSEPGNALHAATSSVMTTRNDNLSLGDADDLELHVNDIDIERAKDFALDTGNDNDYEMDSDVESTYTATNSMSFTFNPITTEKAMPGVTSQRRQRAPRRQWSAHDQQLLEDLVKQFGEKWDDIHRNYSDKFQINWTKKDLQKRWARVQKKNLSPLWQGLCCNGRMLCIFLNLFNFTFFFYFCLSDIIRFNHFASPNEIKS
ncbi:hypothetical protein RFI_03998 [Reticulomyxa filosa]|uniref:Myb-like domain-containing protein n=1 Tax=Reticulomyxa filosa TaxID=46433 RepID=X6P4V1_RETFI|nr:hypothetical protein RFI_03998 [Reticulomyxa filosa]|eukprot:ETO33109.1 hypothetical protein RFI_03998 [Reticulomyxa filosa]